MGCREALPHQAGETTAGQVERQAAHAQGLEVIQPVRVAHAEGAVDHRAAIASAGAARQAALGYLGQAAFALREADFHGRAVVAAHNGDREGRRTLVAVAVLDGVAKAEVDALAVVQRSQQRDGPGQLEVEAAVRIQGNHTKVRVHLAAAIGALQGHVGLPGHELEGQVRTAVVVIQHIAQYARAVLVGGPPIVPGQGYTIGRGLFFGASGYFGIGEFGNESDGVGGKADAGVQATGGLAQQHEGVPAAGSAGACTRTGAGCGGFGDLGRVNAGLDGGLQCLDVGEVLLAGGGRRAVSRAVRIGTARQQRVVQHHAATTSEHQFLAVAQGHRHGPVAAGFQLLAEEHAVAFGEQPARTIEPDREDFTNDLPNDPD
ncbi:hypothetical protein FQZ97_781390 [compost metagenome]